MKLRPYQEDAIANSVKALKEHNNALLVAPTGSGKTVMISNVINKLEMPSTFVLVHAKEINEQNYQEYKGLHPSASTAYFTAEDKELLSDGVTFCMMQSLVSALKIGLRLPVIPDLLVIDEVHHVRSSSYELLVNYFRSMNPSMLLFGATATPERGDGLGLDKFFDEKTRYEIEFRTLIESGALMNPTIKVVDDKDIEKAMLSSSKNIDAEEIIPANQSIVNHWISENKDKLRKTIGFARNIGRAYQLRNTFRVFGIKAEVATHKHTKKERESILYNYTDGDTQVLLNVKMFAEGFNHPETSCIMLMRGRSNKSLMIQMIGRGLRIAPNKEDALIIDFGESMKTHKDLLPKRGMKDKEKGISLSEAVETEKEGEEEKKELIDFNLKVFECLPIEVGFKGDWMALDKKGTCLITGCLHHSAVVTKLPNNKHLVITINSQERTNKVMLHKNSTIEEVSNKLMDELKKEGLSNDYDRSIKSMKAKSLSDSQRKYIPEHLQEKFNRYEGSLYLTGMFNKKVIKSVNREFGNKVNLMY